MRKNALLADAGTKRPPAREDCGLMPQTQPQPQTCAVCGKRHAGECVAGPTIWR